MNRVVAPEDHVEARQNEPTAVSWPCSGQPACDGVWVGRLRVCRLCGCRGESVWTGRWTVCVVVAVCAVIC